MVILTVSKSFRFIDGKYIVLKELLVNMCLEHGL